MPLGTVEECVGMTEAEVELLAFEAAPAVEKPAEEEEEVAVTGEVLLDGAIDEPDPGLELAEPEGLVGGSIDGVELGIDVTMLLVA